MCLENAKGKTVKIPDDNNEPRRQLVDYLLENSTRFIEKVNKEFTKRMKCMRRPRQLPSEEMFLACYKFAIEIRVYHGAEWHVIYKRSNLDNLPIIY